MNTKIYIPPLKIQGIKTKIVPTIKNNIILSENTVWIEPFMGSGVVGFNIAPNNAIFSDTNPYIIQFYNNLKDKVITSKIIRQYLESESVKLQERDAEYYYEVRNRFNREHSSLDFLFLNRSCFNGMMRFNRKGEFNVPYCHKPGRFSKAYITKIVHQIEYIEKQLETHNWTFICQSFEETIALANNIEDAFIYCDPPYMGRSTNYYDSWDITKEHLLKESLLASQKNFMVSTWDHNKYRSNECLTSIWNFCNKINISHFYYVGGKQENRESMLEALLINYPPPPTN